MAGSDITVTALTATPTLRGTKLVATINDPRDGAVPNLAADAVEFYAATVNNFASATNVVEGPGVASGQSEASHEGLIEEQTYYYWARVRNKIGSVGAKFPVSDTGGVSATAIGMSGLAFGLANGKLVASVASNALTVALKTVAGGDPSPGDPVYVAFRSATLATGSYIVREITGTISTTIAAGTSFLFSNNESFRLWWCLFDDAGTLRLAFMKCRYSLGVHTLPEHALSSVGALSGTVTAGLFYANQAISQKAFRIVGYTEWLPNTLPTNGQFSAAPDIIQMFGPDIKKPGDQVNFNSGVVAGSSGAVNAIPIDNTPPLDTEGGSFLNIPLTPTSAANAVRIEADHNLARSSAGILVMTLFMTGSANARRVATGYAAADIMITISTSVTIPLDSSSSLTFSVRYGGDGGATVYLNGNSTGGLFSASLGYSRIAVTEIMG